MNILLRRCALVKYDNVCLSSRLFAKKKELKPEEWQIRKMKSKLKSVQDDIKEYDLSNLLTGLVIERQSEKLLVQIDDKQSSEHTSLSMTELLCSQKSHLVNANIVAGDTVHLSVDKGVGCVVSMDERRNVLQRPSADSNMHKLKMKAIASNIDQLLVVVATVPQVPNSVLDRYIVAAHSYGIPNITIVINKFDLAGSEQLAARMAHYEDRLGYAIVRSSTELPGGLDALKAILSDKTSIFMGQSGVGKSSLINCVLPGAQIKTGELVAKGRTGAHTTSNARLYHLPSGGKLIDAPGIRDLGTWHLDRAAILNGFSEIHEHAQNCKFRNCTHSAAESKFCGVQTALAQGLILEERWRSFVNMNIN
jgi:ribosome biogenesis GTPase